MAVSSVIGPFVLRDAQAGFSANLRDCILLSSLTNRGGPRWTNIFSQFLILFQLNFNFYIEFLMQKSDRVPYGLVTVIN